MEAEVLLRNNVTIVGQGKKNMLFAHGYGCDSSIWRFITPAFEDDYRLTLFDHVGFGESDDTGYSAEKYNSLQAYANDMLEICEELALTDVIFVGHSVSAMIGVLAANAKPEIFKNLILVGPSPRYINDLDYKGGFRQEEIAGMLEALDSDFYAWSSVIAPVIIGNSGIPKLSDELADSFCRSNLEIAKAFAHLMFLGDNRADLPKVKTDTLILQCSEDAIAPLEVGWFMKEQIPESKLQILKATGHCPHLTAPSETIAAIKDYLQN